MQIPSIRHLSENSLKGRTSLCNDNTARFNRRNNPPNSSVEEEIKAMGVKLIDGDQYYTLSNIDIFDTKST
ncbi:DUF4256 domain-containing protein [Anaerococcus prevotii]|uniref:DUF4256 domain-containing protein n=1 Tax=Anaerococcus prevotii TaxID=33034 RepID=UPI000E20B864